MRQKHILCCNAITDSLPAIGCDLVYEVAPTRNRSDKGHKKSTNFGTGICRCILHKGGRSYIADTGICMLREIDLSRANVTLVAGFHGVREWHDRTTAALYFLTNLTLSQYPRFFLFPDTVRGRAGQLLPRCVQRKARVSNASASTDGPAGMRLEAYA